MATRSRRAFLEAVAIAPVAKRSDLEPSLLFFRYAETCIVRDVQWKKCIAASTKSPHQAF
jgi:hypothetical protein